MESNIGFDSPSDSHNENSNWGLHFVILCGWAGVYAHYELVSLNPMFFFLLKFFFILKWFLSVVRIKCLSLLCSLLSFALLQDKI